MKKLLALMLAVMMLLSLAACGGGDDTPSGNEDNPPSSGQQQEQNTPDPDEGGEEVSGQDYDNVGFTKAQRQVIAEQIGVTTEGEKVVFMYVPEDGDEVIYIDVYDEFNGTTCRYTDWRFCINKEAFDGEHSDAADSYEDLTVDEKNLYLYGSEEADFSWAGTWQAVVDYHNEHTAPYNDDYIIVE